MNYPWRDDPLLEGRFHPDFPDDLQVLVHEGGPRLSSRSPELMWARTIGTEGGAYVATLLNQPHHLQTLHEGAEVLYVIPDGAEYPIRVTAKYLEERAAWHIEACTRCGLTELFDAPSDLLRTIFPNQTADVSMEMFTSFCPLCGGVQGVVRRDAIQAMTDEGPTVQKPWWRFWK